MIDHLPNIPWSPEAALGDAMNRTDDMECVVVIWLDKEGIQHYRGAGGVEKDILWMLETEKNSLITGE